MPVISSSWFPSDSSPQSLEAEVSDLQQQNEEMTAAYQASQQAQEQSLEQFSAMQQQLATAHQQNGELEGRLAQVVKENKVRNTAMT